MRKAVWIVIIAWFCTESSFAQNVLDTIRIEASKPFLNAQLKPNRTYSDTVYSGITDFLSQLPGAQMQLNNPGGLTTLLHRGSGNRHLPILWQGFNIQSTINGSYDLGLIPDFLFNEIRFYSVGNTSMQGNNGLAGSLTLNNFPLGENKLKIMVNATSLQNYGAGVSLFCRSNRYYYKMGIESGYDKNAYDYTFNFERKERQTTDFQHHNIVINTGYNLSSKNMIKGSIWWQKADRIIPVSITSSSIIQTQNDQNLRSSFSFLNYSQRWKWNTEVMYSREHLDFIAPSTDSRAKTNIFIFKTDLTEAQNQKYYLGIQHRLDLANPNFYTEIKKRNTTQLSFVINLQQSQDWMTQLSIRQDITDKEVMPFSWTVYNRYKDFELTLASNYNLPGLNDLYWPIGGNPDLKTEKGYKSELKYTQNLSGYRINGAVYANITNDWIQWIPGSSAFWSAVNQKKIFSRGLEAEVSKDFYINTLASSMSVGYDFNRTSALDHYYDPALVGKQLIYIPIHKASASWRVTKDSHTLSLQYSMTGKRYDSADESSSLPMVHLLNAHYNLKINKHLLKIDLENILNKEYTIVRYYPLPGINGRVTFIFHLN